MRKKFQCCCLFSKWVEQWIMFYLPITLNKYLLNKWKSVIYVKGKIQFITELNLLITKVGFFVAKIVGRLFQKKANILMGGPGNQKRRTYKSLLRLLKWHIQEEQNWNIHKTKLDNWWNFGVSFFLTCDLLIQYHH